MKKKVKPEIDQAREMYKKGELTFKELDKIFFKNASKEQITEFYNAPVFDRPSVVMGHSQAQRDSFFL